jgi:hypothetical protein
MPLSCLKASVSRSSKFTTEDITRQAVRHEQAGLIEPLNWFLSLQVAIECIKSNTIYVVHISCRTDHHFESLLDILPGYWPFHRSLCSP